MEDMVPENQGDNKSTIQYHLERGGDREREEQEVKEKKKTSSSSQERFNQWKN